MASTSTNRQAIISGLIQSIQSNGFDWIGIDWECPGADDRGGRVGDTANFVLLCQEMRAAFGS